MLLLVLHLMLPLTLIQLLVLTFPVSPAGPGSSAECLDQAKLRACLAKSKGSNPAAWPQGNPADCGCRNGNEGMKTLSDELRAMGFSWGSYSNEAGCKVAACNTSALNSSRMRGFVVSSAAYRLFKRVVFLCENGPSASHTSTL